VESNEISADGKQTIILNGTNDSTTSKVNIMASTDEGKTSVMLNYSGPK